MGMTIDKSIAELEVLKKNTFSYMSAHQAFITAIDTMRKYQKIEEAYKKYLNDMVTNIYADRKLIKALSEVLENGNE